MSEMKKKIVYFDMDNVLVNFQSGIDATPIEVQKEYEGQLDNVPGIFSMMKPNSEMVDLFNKMSDDVRYDVYILSTSPWDNPTAASDKVEWVKKYLPKAYKRVILSHHKHLNIGDYLIDDRTANGAGKFGGELIQYMSDKFPTVKSIENYLI
jgi:5'(3')-deoxyribonucleotidase